MKLLYIIISILLLTIPTHAQIKPNAQTTKLVSSISKAFFTQLIKEDFEIEHTYMSDQLKNLMPNSEWQIYREKTIELTGATPQFLAHGLRYYQQKKMLAAVDFSGKAVKPNIYVCGFLLWEISEPNKIELIRFEVNTIFLEVVNAMRKQKAAQLMTNFRCPPAMIETILGISLQ